METHIMASERPGYPSVSSSFLKREYKDFEKKAVLQYTQKYEPFSVGGLVYDCVKGQYLKEADTAYTDGKYVWTKEDLYHIKKYDAAVIDDFLEQVLM